MTSAQEKRARAARLRAEADRLEREAHAERPLPERWELGQRVRYIRGQQWGPSVGDVGTVVRVREEDLGKPADQYQVFWVGFGSPGMFWTTPDDVELVVDP